MAGVNNYGATTSLSVRMLFAIVTNQMEERVLKNKLGSIEQEEKRLMRRYRSETRLLKIKQEQRLGNLSLKRQDTKGAHIKGSLSPQSPEVQTCFSYGKRQSSKCVYVSETFQESGNPVFFTEPESPQTAERLPRLSICQSPIRPKEDFLSPHRKSSEASTCFVTEERAKQSSSPQRRRKTWNGKTVQKIHLSLSVPPRLRSFSEEDARLRDCNDLQTHLDPQKDLGASANDSITTGMKPNEFPKMAFPTAEDVQSGNFLSAPKLLVCRSSSLNSLKSVDSLPSVFKNRNGLIRNEEKAVTCSSPVRSKKTNTHCQSPGYHSGNMGLLQRRHRPLRRQGNVLEDISSFDAVNIPRENSIKLPCALSKSGTDAARKESVKCQSLGIRNGHEQAPETTLEKDAPGKLGTITARSSSSSSHCPKEDKPRIKITLKRKQESLEVQEKNHAEPFDKSKWLKALRKVFNVNRFLSRMVALQKPREQDRLAVEQKQAELEKLYEELKHCRYLRLPYDDDNNEKDSVAWVFSKD